MSEERFIKIEYRQANLEDALNKVVNQMEKLIAAIGKNYDSNHQIEILLKELQVKYDNNEEEDKKLEVRVTKLEDSRHATMVAILSAIGMAALGVLVHLVTGA